MTEPSSSCGHVFVLNCAVENLAADVILVPGNPGPAEGVQALPEAAKQPAPTVFEAAANPGNGEDLRILHVSVAFCIGIVDAFLAAAGPAVTGTKSKFKRAKPLVGMPIPGVGVMDDGDACKKEGAVIEQVLTKLYEAADKYGVDIAVCLQDVDAFRVAQVARASCCPWSGGPFWMLSEALQTQVTRLHDSAEAGRLSIFFGAGVSFPSGLPSWGGLLEELAEKAGFDEDTKKELKDLSFMDQPTLIEERMGPAFRQCIGDCVSAGRYTPAHTLLAQLGLPAVTTNYDVLYESARESAGKEIVTLPWEAHKIIETPSLPTVTKMHGCARRPESIVLTMADYIRYPDMRQALRGRLQNLFLTTEVLVVGFSMTDSNVATVIDQVRKVVYQDGKSKARMGTVTTLVENKQFRQLWDQDFHVVSFGKSWADNPAWIHDCFLDALAFRIEERQSHMSFLLNPKFVHMLSDGERKIAEALSKVSELKEDKDAQGAAPCWKAVKAMLESFGMPAPSRHADRLGLPK